MEILSKTGMMTGLILLLSGRLSGASDPNTLLLSPIFLSVAEGAPTVSELLDRYTEALDSTISFIADYEQTTEASYRLHGRQAQGKKVFKRGHIRHDDQRHYDRQYCWGDFAKYKDLPEDKSYYYCTVADGEKKRVYSNNGWIHDPNQSLSARTDPYTRKEKISLSRDFGISCILGYVGSDERLDTLLRKADRISVREKSQTMNGSECFIILAETQCGHYAVWLDSDHGYHPAQVMHRAGAGNYSYGHQMAKGDSAKTCLRNVRFEQIESVWVPVEAESESNLIAANGEFSKDNNHYKRINIILNPDHEKLGSFADPILENPANDPGLKDGTRVRMNHKEYVWKDGALTDVDGNKGNL